MLKFNPKLRYTPLDVVSPVVYSKMRREGFDSHGVIDFDYYLGIKQCDTSHLLNKKSKILFNYVNTHGSLNIFYDLGSFILRLRYSDEKILGLAEVFSDFKNEKANKLVQDIIDFREEEREKHFNKKAAKVNFLISGGDGLSMERVSLDDTPELDFSYYCEGTEDFHKNLLSNINESGLTLIHGEPGTGKTTYIKMLTGIVDKEFVFMSTGMASTLSSPQLLGFLMKRCKESVLILEDAEECLVSNGSRSSAITNILNMTSGILGSALKIHIIATFNTGLNNIDPALKRAGRLKSQHEFKKLKSAKVIQLTNGEMSNDATISEIKNHTVSVSSQRRKIGF